MDIKQLRAKMTPESEQSTRRPTMPARDSSGSSWSRMSMRQKSTFAAAVLGLGLYLRRRRSQSSDRTVSDGGSGSRVVDHDATQSVESEHPDASGSKGRSLARRLVMTVLTTVALSLARRAYRRFRRNR